MINESTRIIEDPGALVCFVGCRVVKMLLVCDCVGCWKLLCAGARAGVGVHVHVGRNMLSVSGEMLLTGEVLRRIFVET